MEKISELLVVEGKHDRQKLEKLFSCDVVCTNGLSLDDETLNLIRKAAESRGVILLLDPDNPGERIRRRIMEVCPEARHIFIDKNKAIGRRNVGVEYVSDEDLKEALQNVITFRQNNESLKWEEYLNMGFMGNKALRDKVCHQLGIGPCNNKTLFKRLNMLDVSSEELRKLIDE